MAETRKTGPDDIQAVVMVVDILEFMATSREPVGVTALARALNTSKSRIYRYLRTLVRLGYIIQVEETERYRIGTRLITLGRTVSESFDLSAAARDVLHDLRDSLGHAVVVSHLETGGLRAISSLSGNKIYETGVKHGALLHFHATAQGKVALAFGPDGLREKVLRSRLTADTPTTIVDPDRLRGELERIRRQGWAVSPNEALLGVNALAAPIYDSTNALVGTVAIIDSIQFIHEHPSREQIDHVMRAAERISQALGFVPQSVTFLRA